MANVNRWMPNRLNTWDRDLLDEMERAFTEPFFGRRWSQDRNGTWGLPLDVSEREDKYVIRASIPGINPEDIDLSISDNVLTIRGNVSQSADDESENYVLRERRMGSFTRSVTFPMPVDSDAAEAMCEHGVLTIHLPKAATARPRRINIGGGAPRRQTIEAQAPGAPNGHAAGSQGWTEGQARPGRQSTEARREGEGWTEGQSDTGSGTNVPRSSGWTEGQSQQWDEKTPHSEGWTEGMDKAQS